MTLQRPIIVDTNILFSAMLRKKSGFAEVLLNSTHQFYICEQVILEIFKHKEKLVKSSQLSEDEIINLYRILLKYLNLFKEDSDRPKKLGHGL